MWPSLVKIKMPGILVFPVVAGCRGLCPYMADDAPLADVIASPEVRGALKVLSRHTMGTPEQQHAHCPALPMAEPPNIDGK